MNSRLPHQRFISAFADISSLVVGRYKLKFAGITFLGFLSGLLEAVGVNTVIPLFSLISGTGHTASDPISRSLQEILSALHIGFNPPVLLAFIAGTFVAKACLTYAVNVVTIRTVADFEKDTRTRLFRATLASSWNHLLRQKIGYLEKVLVNDIGQCTYLLRYISQSILLAANITMYTLVAINISAPITLAVFVVGGILFLSSKRILYRIRRISKEFGETEKEEAHYVNETMLGIKSIKTMQVENAVVEKGIGFFERLRTMRVKNFTLQARATEFVEPIGMIFIVGVFAASYRAPEFNFASFAVIIFLIHKIFAYLQNVQQKLQNMSEQLPYLRSVNKTFQNAHNAQEDDRGTLPFHFREKLSFEDVLFAYPGGKEVLRNISFLLARGGMVGLVGPSGAGKTTIVDLILRLYEPTSGRFTVDGTPVSSISLAAWRRSIGYVAQDIFLLNDTIENNIRFYNATLTPAAIQNAVSLAQLDPLIRDLPKGMHTVVGERGVLLSGGQRQRVILARILARNPHILVLDEATSALDNESEYHIQKAIEGLKGAVTTFVIAHRLSTVLRCDHVMILDRGTIIESGAPAVLLANKQSHFHKLYTIGEANNDHGVLKPRA